ncbi:hypothetical protein ATO6_22260 [Oceanicola sp. 22II-s10i]|uniref:hypothetical protein n=1 Tax=Oceanicola sp. 22II-s10i TaxID=1317116 RepID=UPI000B51F473|nr:hypothetical protein [Oceanicola sp. 22II-s10i]OWU82347.1 hypothetical protein ATO6_22260 [Oceanicola sp. 22II-s10i]
MSAAGSEARLRGVLWLDAGICAVFAVFCVLARGWLTTGLGLPGWLVTWGAVILVAAALLMALTAWRRPLARGLLVLVVAGNVGWVVASVLVALAGLAGNGWGTAFVLVQAAGVLPLLLVEARGLSQSAQAV